MADARLVSADVDQVLVIVDLADLDLDPVGLGPDPADLDRLDPVDRRGAVVPVDRRLQRTGRKQKITFGNRF